MVTAAQVKTYLQPLLAAHSDLVLVGRLMVVKPVHHVLRAVLIDRYSWAEGMRPSWLIHHMFGPHPGYHLGWGDQLWSRSWRTTDHDIAEALCAQIEEFALPKLRSIHSLRDFVAAVPSTPSGHLWSIDAKGKSIIDIAMGDFESARALCQDKICQRPNPDPKESEEFIVKLAGAKKLCALLADDDVAGLIRTLHQWEAANVKKLKLEKYWEPTPFPIEEKFG